MRDVRDSFRSDAITLITNETGDDSTVACGY
jgi:hypothetical protein